MKEDLEEAVSEAEQEVLRTQRRARGEKGPNKVIPEEETKKIEILVNFKNLKT